MVNAAPPACSPRRKRPLLPATAAALIGIVTFSLAAGDTEALPQSMGASASTASVPTSWSTPSATAPAQVPAMAQYTLERSAPLAVRIHRIGVNAPVMGLTTDPSGVLQVPPVADSNLAGWYQDGPTPGERGNAIVLGHVDTTSGPAVFYGLSTLKPGDTVDIDRADGYTATFRVDDVELFSKKDFPDDRVYGDADEAQLRLITCGGTYDHKHHDYTGNVVVFAHLASVRRT